MRIEVVLHAESTRAPEEVQAELTKLLSKGLVRVGLKAEGITGTKVVSARDLDAAPPPTIRPPRIA
jgi:hypothetical protein